MDNGEKVEDHYTIQSGADEGGTISPNGDVMVSSGEAQTFTILPKPGYMIDHVDVDDVNQGAISYYTFPSVSADGHTIHACFKKAYELLDENLTLSEDAKTITVSGLQSLTASTLSGMVFDEKGQFLCYADVPVSANASSASISFDTAIPENAAVKLILLDAESKPLCMYASLTK